MEPLALLQSAQQTSLDVVRQVNGEHHSLATPCGGWDVARLLDKMVTSALLFATLCRGEKPGPELNLLFPGPVAGAAPTETYAAAIDECQRAFEESELEGEMMGPLGVMVPRAAGLKVRAMDCTLNTWDLARSIGAHPGVDPRVPDGLIEFATGFLAKVRERDDHVRFDEPVSIGGDSGSSLDALVALSGRDPAWRPPPAA